MAVYTIPRDRAWLDYAAPAVASLLGGVVDNHFEGKRQQRDFDFQQQNAEAEFQRKQQEQALINQSVDDLINGGGFDPANPQAYFGNVMRMGAQHAHLAPHIKEMMQQAQPHKTFQNVDLGGSVRYGSFDPASGDALLEEAVRSLSPDVGAQTDAQRYVSDNSLAGTRYASDASRAVAGINAGARNAAPRQLPQLVQDAAGNYVWADAGAQTLTPTEIAGPLPTPKTPQAKQPYTMSDIANLKKTNRDGVGRVVDPKLEQQYDVWMNNLTGGQAAPAPAGPVGAGNQLPTQPTEIVPGTDLLMSDPRVQRAIAAGYSLDEIAQYGRGGGSK